VNVAAALRVVLVFVIPSPLAAQLIVKQSPDSDRAFDAYIKTVEGQLDWRPHVTLDKNVSVKIVPAAPNPTANTTIDLPGAIIHDWAGAILVPGATVDKALTVLQSYDDYKRIYAPQVTESKLYSHQGNHWRSYLKLYKRALLPAIFDTEYDVEYRELDRRRWAVLSHSTRVAEIDGGKVLPVGTGHGYLWRLNAYWLLEQRPAGVYLECRAVSMSRDIPLGLAWAIKPMITSLPRDSLQQTLDATASALR
jgi:hypothetical protein